MSSITHGEPTVTPEALYALRLVNPDYIAEALRERITMLVDDLGDLANLAALAAPGSHRSVMAGPRVEIQGRIAEARYWRQWLENIMAPVSKAG